MKVASKIARQQSSGCDARRLIAPELDASFGEISQTPLPPRRGSVKKKQKNHMMSNKKALREMQQIKQNNENQNQEKAKQERLRREMVKNRHFGNVKSKVFRCDTASTSSSTQSSSSGYSSPSSTIAVAEGYENNDRHNPRWNIEKSSQKYVDVDSKDGSFQKHKTFGHVPTYITERRARMADEEKMRQERIRQEEEDLPPAEGMVRMPESERLETQRLLKENENDVRAQLQRLPISAAPKKRERLEVRIREIEEANNLFSKDKVYIQKPT